MAARFAMFCKHHYLSAGWAVQVSVQAGKTCLFERKLRESHCLYVLRAVSTAKTCLCERKFRESHCFFEKTCLYEKFERYSHGFRAGRVDSTAKTCLFEKFERYSHCFRAGQVVSTAKTCLFENYARYSHGLNADPLSEWVAQAGKHSQSRGMISFRMIKSIIVISIVPRLSKLRIRLLPRTSPSR